MSKTLLNQPQELNTPGEVEEDNSSNVNSEPTLHPRVAESDDSFQRMEDQ